MLNSCQDAVLDLNLLGLWAVGSTEFQQTLVLYIPVDLYGAFQWRFLCMFFSFRPLLVLEYLDQFWPQATLLGLWEHSGYPLSDCLCLQVSRFFKIWLDSQVPSHFSSTLCRPKHHWSAFPPSVGGRAMETGNSLVSVWSSSVLAGDMKLLFTMSR